jgi:hypothetical protein
LHQSLRERKARGVPPWIEHHYHLFDAPRSDTRQIVDLKVCLSPPHERQID